MKTRVVLILTMLLLLLSSSYAFKGVKPLTADKAFHVSVVVDNNNQVLVNLQIEQGYYLYRQKIHFTFEPNLTTDIRLPQGEVKQDLNHAQYEIYTGNVTIPIVLRTDLQHVKFNMDYQGCSAKGFCYPPMHKSMTLDLVGKAAAPAPTTNKIATDVQGATLQTLLTNQHQVQALFGQHNIFVMLLIFMLIGLLLAFTPCVFPMIPILTCIIVGHNLPVSTKRAFFLSVTYVLGASLTYALAGMLAAYMGGSLQAALQQPWIIAIVSGFFVLLAMSLFGVYDLQLPRSWQNRITAISRKQQGGTFVGVFIIGAVSTLIVSPCVTAPLVGVLMYIAQSGNMVLGAGALFAIGLGMGIPLIIIGVSTGKWLPRRGPWMTGVQRLFGVMMLGMAVWLLLRIASTATIMTFAAVLLAGVAVYFGVHKPVHRKVGVLSGSVALLLIVAISFMPNVKSISSSSSVFKIVRNMDELSQQLSLAKALGKPVLLDFYADWCESCVDMDKNVFSTADVMNHLDKFVLLRADLSNNSAADEILLKTFDVVAPPTVLFFNNYGQEVISRRIVGELNAMEFMTRVNTFITASCDKNMTC